VHLRQKGKGVSKYTKKQKKKPEPEPEPEGVEVSRGQTRTPIKRPKGGKPTEEVQGGEE
jgi:hypothetical protein